MLCHVDWGPEGVAAAAVRGDVVIIVDVLSFGTAVSTAVMSGAMIFPCTTQVEALEMAELPATQAAVHRRDVPASGRFSLSPLTMLAAGPGVKISVASPNGATCCRMSESARGTFVAGLVNAGGTARAAAHMARTHACGVTVIACGERHPNGSLRPAVEDWMGAGAIVSHVEAPWSAEAEVCRETYLAVHYRVPELVSESESGRELRAAGYAMDVTYASAIDVHDTAVIMRRGWLIATDSDESE